MSHYAPDDLDLTPYKTPDLDTVYLRLEDDGVAVLVKNLDWPIGRLRYVVVEEDRPDFRLINDMDVHPHYRRQGIMLNCIKLAADKLQLFARRPNGQRYDDGSHLSVEGSLVVAAAMKLNLVRWLDGV